MPINVFTGITDADAAKVVDGLSPKVADRNASIDQVKKLYELFCKCDCTLLEVPNMICVSTSVFYYHFEKIRYLSLGFRCGLAACITSMLI